MMNQRQQEQQDREQKRTMTMMSGLTRRSISRSTRRQSLFILRRSNTTFTSEQYPKSQNTHGILSFPPKSPFMTVTTIVIFLINICTFVDASYTVEVRPNSEECFIFRTPTMIKKGSPSVLIGSFECLEDDVETKELSVTLTDLDSGENVYESPTGSLEGDFRLENILNGPDRYSLCFQNNYDKKVDDDEYSFDIGFNIRVHTPPRVLDDAEEGPDNERATKLAEKAARIHEDWDVLRDHFDFLRNREAIHQKMNDQIMNRLARWNTIEGLLVVAIATAQILYFRAFFEKRRYL